ncbi:hypothetical protein BDR03DRAFT_585036 [Suillus americanus]|nr:hypothetical protein BDR03DRAFT_585036 [Suillus americanus]
MKQGFLNTQKAKQRVAEAVDAESVGGPPHKKFKDKDEKAERYIAITDVVAHCKTTLLQPGFKYTSRIHGFKHD